MQTPSGAPRRRRSGAGALAALALLLSGCTAALRPAPDLGGIYDRAASARDDLRNPIVVIPGVLGTRLRSESGRVVWGAFSGTYADPRRGDGMRLVALPMAEGVALRDLRDQVRPDGVLDSVRVSVLGLPVQQHAYVYLLRTLGVGGYKDQQLALAGAIDYGSDHFTCFQFDYDWRRDNVENARRLGAFLRGKSEYVAGELARRTGVRKRPEDVRFDLVAHSMGGLVARWFLRYGEADLPEDGGPPPLTWAGAAQVDQLVLVGTPNGGSLLALRDLVEGTRLAFVVPRYPPAVVGTMPSLYQLLPRTRHAVVVDAGDAPLDLFDPGVWERYGWGLAAPDPAALRELLPDAADDAERLRIARDHLRKVLARARRFQAALDVPASPPPGTALHLFAGDAEPTPARARALPGGALSVLATAPGDGTVTRASAVMDERTGRPASRWRPGVVSPVAWSQVTFVFSDHLGMTRDPAFTDNILYRLLESPRARQ